MEMPLMITLDLSISRTRDQKPETIPPYARYIDLRH